MSTLTHSLSPANCHDDFEPSAADLSEYAAWAARVNHELWLERIELDDYCGPTEEDDAWYAEQVARAERRADHDAALTRHRETIRECREYLDAMEAKARRQCGYEEAELAEMGSTLGHDDRR